jgi:ABC-type lipoprotein export system ATPase subunit
MINPQVTGPVLSIEELRFGYEPQSAWALAVPYLSLARSEQMLLRGGSGQGKSTLLLVVAGLYDPSRGRVIVAGTDVHSLRGAARDQFRGRAIGMIFQTFNLMHGFSAIENVMAAMMFAEIPRAEHRGRALSLLEHLGIDEPHRDPMRMSVGQQQRVAVARAVACDPVLVLADEPTASLDPENSDTAISLIQSICREKGAALLCVSHDPSMVERFGRVESLEEIQATGAAITQGCGKA